jgi:FtsH-binding integral membrane protein
VTLQLILSVVFVILVVLYIVRRRARLKRETGDRS